MDGATRAGDSGRGDAGRVLDAAQTDGDMSQRPSDASVPDGPNNHADGGAGDGGAPDAGGADGGDLGRCADFDEWVCAGGGGMCRATCGGYELDCFGTGCECNLGAGLQSCAPPPGSDCGQCEALLDSPCCRGT